MKVFKNLNCFVDSKLLFEDINKNINDRMSLNAFIKKRSDEYVEKKKKDKLNY